MVDQRRVIADRKRVGVDQEIMINTQETIEMTILITNTKKTIM